MIWDDDTVYELKRLHYLNHSAREIGRILGCTKNAVIGKINRMKKAGNFKKPQGAPPTIKKKKHSRWVTLRETGEGTCRHTTDGEHYCNAKVENSIFSYCTEHREQYIRRPDRKLHEETNARYYRKRVTKMLGY